MEIVIFVFGVAFGALGCYLKFFKTSQEVAKDADDINSLRTENKRLQKQIEEVRTELATIVMAPVSEPVLQPVQTLNIAYPGTKRKFDFAVIPGYKYAFLPREVQEASKRYRNLSL